VAGFATPVGHTPQIRSRADRKFHPHAGAREHRHEHVEAEQIQTPPHEIADSGLRDAKHLGRPTLSEASPLDDPQDAIHQARPELKAKGLDLTESDVDKDAAA